MIYAMADTSDLSPELPTTPSAGGPVKVTASRASYTWIGLVIGALLGILLLIFILQNLNDATVTMFFWDFTMPVGVTVLLSAIGGALIMALVGGIRIVQLRNVAKRAH
jgi:uncharacterized integral membrane protein